MSAEERKITRDDILDLDEYEKVRKDKRREVMEKKKNRRLDVGPDCTFYFESYDTMWLQIHEMLRIEKGGEAQIDDELDAYNPLIPQGNDLTATVMFEIDDPRRRDDLLGRLGGVEEKIFLSIGDDRIQARYEQDVERSTEGGRASSVHFISFPLDDAQKETFKAGDAAVTVSIEHPAYEHRAEMPQAVRRELAGDLDQA